MDLAKWAQENHVILMSPHTNNSPQILQFDNDTNKFAFVSTEDLEDCDSLIKNSRSITGIFRHGVEQAFGGKLDISKYP